MLAHGRGRVKCETEYMQQELTTSPTFNLYAITAVPPTFSWLNFGIYNQARISTRLRAPSDTSHHATSFTLRRRLLTTHLVAVIHRSEF